MNATYWTAKYVEDPFRNEPKNVGVIVCIDGRYAARFVGERDDQTIDARKLRGFLYPAVYSQWRDFWRRKIQACDIEAITRGNTTNFFVEAGGEVTDTGGDTADEVCRFLYGLLVGEGPAEAYEWVDLEDVEFDLASEITSAFAQVEVLATGGELFAPHPVIKELGVVGRHVMHKPSFSQRNGRLYVMEHIDLTVKRVNKAKERAGWMAYMFSDIKDANPDTEAYSLVRPEQDGGGEQIEYAKAVLRGESTVINWADPRQRLSFLEERRMIAHHLMVG